MSDKGAVLIEASIIIPLLVALFMGMYDGYRAIQSYLTLSELAHEAVRFAARVPGLQPGTYCTNCPPGVATPAPTPAHAAIHDRLTALQLAKSWHAPLTGLEIVSQLQDATSTGITGYLGAGDAAEAGVIKLQLRGLYQGLFTNYIFGNQLVTVIVAAEYLG